MEAIDFAFWIICLRKRSFQVAEVLSDVGDIDSEVVGLLLDLFMLFVQRFEELSDKFSDFGFDVVEDHV